LCFAKSKSANQEPKEPNLPPVLRGAQDQRLCILANRLQTKRF
jgi:hypothetical protein